MRGINRQSRPSPLLWHCTFAHRLILFLEALGLLAGLNVIEGEPDEGRGGHIKFVRVISIRRYKKKGAQIIRPPLQTHRVQHSNVPFRISKGLHRYRGGIFDRYAFAFGDLA
jgi:hypothetical protein